MASAFSSYKNNNCVRDILLVGLLLIATLNINGVIARKPQEPYYGTLIGQFQQLAHGLGGRVYAVDDSTLFVKNFAYDGTGPDAYFWAGMTPRPSPDGFIIPYPDDYSGPVPPILSVHNKSDIILRLPMGRRLQNMKYLAVWCRRFTVNFGHVNIPEKIDVPKTRVLSEFKRFAHGLRSSNISVLDAKTFYIPNLHYDGAGPDAYFWVGNGTEPNVMGTKVPNEVGSLEKLRGYQGEDIEIQLPGDLTVYDIDWLAVWCVEYQHNFGHVMIPNDLDVPPALGQTKITPWWWYKPTAKPTTNNCRELLGGKLQVKWEIEGEYVVVELFGRIEDNQYMAFGLSGSQGRPEMKNADVVVAFYDLHQKEYRAEDYFISHYSQCDGKQGVCPDIRIGGKDDVTVLSGERKNGVTSIKYKRLLQTNEPVNDQAILADREISVIAAIGPLNSRKEANAHSKSGDDVNANDIKINFASKNDHSCISSLYDQKTNNDNIIPWPTRKLENVDTFNFKIGPTGGMKGYTPLTGHPSWGIAIWINDLLIPEIYVERNKTYQFIIETGEDKTNSARYHPIYITDSKEGGFGQKSSTEQQQQLKVAGVDYDIMGYPVPTLVGRYCEWEHKTIDMWNQSETFEDYTKTLKLECVNGEPGMFNWTVPWDAPDNLFYQCYTHLNLGWKIHVLDPNGYNEISARSHAATPILSLTIKSAPVILLVHLIVYWVHKIE